MFDLVVKRSEEAQGNYLKKNHDITIVHLLMLHVKFKGYLSTGSGGEGFKKVFCYGGHVSQVTSIV